MAVNLEAELKEARLKIKNLQVANKELSELLVNPHRYDGWASATSYEETIMNQQNIINGLREDVEKLKRTAEILRNRFSHQNSMMKFDPTTGTEFPYPSNAQQYRDWHGKVAWLYNPWTGKPRDVGDIGSDVTGLLIECEKNIPVRTKLSIPRLGIYEL